MKGKSKITLLRTVCMVVCLCVCICSCLTVGATTSQNEYEDIISSYVEFSGETNAITAAAFVRYYGSVSPMPEATLICAAYEENENGELMLIDVSVKKGINCILKTEALDASGADLVKAYVWDANSMKVVSDEAEYKADADYDSEDMSIMVTIEGVNGDQPFKLPPDPGMEAVAPYRNYWKPDLNTYVLYLPANSPAPKVTATPVSGNTAHVYIDDDTKPHKGSIILKVRNGSRKLGNGTYTYGKEVSYTIQNSGEAAFTKSTSIKADSSKITYINPSTGEVSTESILAPTQSTIMINPYVRVGNYYKDSTTSGAIQSFPGIFEIEGCEFVNGWYEWSQKGTQYAANYRNTPWAGFQVTTELKDLDKETAIGKTIDWSEFVVTEDCEIIAFDVEPKAGYLGNYQPKSGWAESAISLGEEYMIDTAFDGTDLKFAHIKLARAGETVKNEVGYYGGRTNIFVIRPISHKKSN